MMRQSLTSSSLMTVEKELERLYHQRSAVERLIESVEQYHARFLAIPAQRARSAAMPSVQRIAS